MKTLNTGDRIASLRRYVALVRQEEKRLNWLSASSSIPATERKDAVAKLQSLSEKIARAERELSELELGRIR